MIKSFKKVGIADGAGADFGKNLAKVQENIESALGPVLTCPLLDGVLVKSVSLSTTATLVEHRLSRAALGYIVTSRDASETVWNSSTNPAPEKFLTLLASGPVTVDLWVF